MRRATRAIVALALGLFASACSSWQHIETRERWSLYAKPGELLDSAKYDRALEPAFRAVEARMGPFENRVNIHAWNAREEVDDTPKLPSEGTERIEDVPGIGKARVRAYHVTGGASPFSPRGVFLGTAEVGTVVHELVHARLAEEGGGVPLWFEEGLASMWGDGAFFDGEWVIDGLACWPARVLREETISDAELTRVMALSASEDCTPRENLLVHFVGWALVFDLARELPAAHHKAWLAHFRSEVGKRTLLAETRTRIARSISPETIELWLERFKDENPGVRLAAAKGMWKLRSQDAVDALIAAMLSEENAQVRLTFGLNALLAAGEMRVSRRTWRDMWRRVVPTLGEVEVTDDPERSSLEQFLAGMRGRGGRTQEALDGLARYWEE